MLSCCDIETDRMQAHRAALPTPEPRRSRLAGLLATFIRHAGTIAVDHTHLMSPARRVAARCLHGEQTQSCCA
jgi:hypothetical protein